MGIDLCATCGDEHEPPRGNKCKRTKLGKKAAKVESKSGICVDTDSSSEEEAAMASLPCVKIVTRLSKKESVAVVEDEEERGLRVQLEKRACERRKKELRAALENSSSEEEGRGRSRHGRGRPLRRKVRGKDTGSSSDSSQDSKEDSSSTTSTQESSSNADSDHSSSKKKRNKRKKKKKKNSKFSLKKLTKTDKSLKRVTFVELMYAALIWGVKRSTKVGMTKSDLRGYMGHLAYMAMHAITGNYTDEAYRGYDKAVREKVTEKGMKHFKMGDHDLSLLHFNLNNSRAMKDNRRQSFRVSSGLKTTEAARLARRACYTFNYSKDSCVAKNCEWEHYCMGCRSKSHGVSTCPGHR